MTTPRRHRSEGEGRVGGQRGLPAYHHSTVVNANAAPPYTQAPHEGVRSFAQLFLFSIVTGTLTPEAETEPVTTTITARSSTGN